MFRDQVGKECRWKAMQLLSPRGWAADPAAWKMAGQEAVCDRAACSLVLLVPGSLQRERLRTVINQFNRYNRSLIAKFWIKDMPVRSRAMDGVRCINQ